MPNGRSSWCWFAIYTPPIIAKHDRCRQVVLVDDEKKLDDGEPRRSQTACSGALLKGGVAMCRGYQRRPRHAHAIVLLHESRSAHTCVPAGESQRTPRCVTNANSERVFHGSHDFSWRSCGRTAEIKDRLLTVTMRCLTSPPAIYGEPHRVFHSVYAPAASAGCWGPSRAVPVCTMSEEDRDRSLRIDNAERCGHSPHSPLAEHQR